MNNIINLDPEYKKKDRIHICTLCYLPFLWTESCWWFGSIENVEYTFCSDKCKYEGIEKFKIPKK